MEVGFAYRYNESVACDDDDDDDDVSVAIFHGRRIDLSERITVIISILYYIMLLFFSMNGNVVVYVYCTWPRVTSHENGSTCVINIYFHLTVSVCSHGDR